MTPYYEVQCRCAWPLRCPNDATQEDGLCDWCAGRSADPGPLPPGRYNEVHLNLERDPDSCWKPGSGAVHAFGRAGWGRD